MRHLDVAISSVKGLIIKQVQIDRSTSCPTVSLKAAWIVWCKSFFLYFMFSDLNIFLPVCTRLICLFSLLLSADFPMQDTSEEFLASVKSSFWRSMAFQMSTGAGGGRTTTFITGTRARLWHELQSLLAITYTFWHWMYFFFAFLFKRVKSQNTHAPAHFFVLLHYSHFLPFLKLYCDKMKYLKMRKFTEKMIYRNCSEWLANKLTFSSASVSSYWLAEVH